MFVQIIGLFSLLFHSSFAQHSPPIFPETFFTYNTIVEHVANLTGHGIGAVAEYYEKKLFMQFVNSSKSPLFPDGSLATTIFSDNKLFSIVQEGDEKPICTCLDLSYEQAGLPFFAPLTDMKYLGENSTEVWWNFMLKGTPAKIPNVLFVRKGDPDSPVVPIEIDIIARNPDFSYVNVSFMNFDMKPPNLNYFTIPGICDELVTHKCKGDEDIEIFRRNRAKKFLFF